MLGENVYELKSLVFFYFEPALCSLIIAGPSPWQSGYCLATDTKSHNRVRAFSQYWDTAGIMQYHLASSEIYLVWLYCDIIRPVGIYLRFDYNVIAFARKKGITCMVIMWLHLASRDIFVFVIEFGQNG